MRGAGTLSEAAVILAPTGRDAEVASRILHEAGFEAVVAADLPSLSRVLVGGAGVAIIADEALRTANVRELADFISKQPPWSDFPFIVLSPRGGGPERNPTAARLADLLGNTSFLERPFHPTTFASLVSTAIRGRRRQYEARGHLEALSDSESQLRTALTAGNLGSWTLDVTTMQLRTSETCRKHFGFPADAPFAYNDLLSAIHPDDAQRMQAAVQRTLETGLDYEIQYRNVWPDSSVHWVEIHAHAMREDDGVVHQLVGVSSDITERKTAEIERENLLQQLARERAALSELTASLEERINERTAELMTEVAAREKTQARLVQSQKMETIGQLTGGVAHDFNNLLMAVMGNLELLRKRLPEDEKTQRLISGALQGAQRGAVLTQRMLAFARQQELTTGPVDLATLLTGMRDLLERTLGPQIQLSLNLSHGLPSANVDANQIELAVLNLTINARDAMPGGGTIAITLKFVPHFEGRKFGPDGCVLLVVADNGSGMDETTLQKAVEPFFSTKEVGKGTGLGLSMVHGLAVQLGGRLHLSSELGVGTTATLVFPASSRDNVVVSNEQEERVPDATKSATILFVDDDALIAASVVDMLEDLGHTVIEANSGKQALEILEGGQTVDLLMTDQAMPGMTGVELARHAAERWPDLPILLATGYADLPSGESSLLPRLGKPYLQDDLKKQINRLLMKAGQR